MRYIYFTNYKFIYENLHNKEMEKLFGCSDQKIFFSEKYIDPSISPFIKSVLKCTYTGDLVEDIISKMKEDNLSLEKYKIEYLKSESTLEYDVWIKALRDIGTSITGEFEIKNPEVKLGLTYIDGRYYFGELIKNNNEWQKRVNKPVSYSISLEVILAKSLLNILLGTDKSKKIIDPCCGVGTVVIEGRFLDLNIIGSDINEEVVKNANQNLDHYNLNSDIEVMDIADIKDKYDLAIIDLPYGKLVKSHRELQGHIFEHAKNIADEICFISMEEIDEKLFNLGYSIKDKFTVPKVNRFLRYVYITNSM